jgi:hypothetical protein
VRYAPVVAKSLAKATSWLRPAPTTTKKRRAIALAVAAAADVLQVAVFPAFVEGAVSPFEDVLDAVVAVALVAILGLRWRLAVAIALELVPGMDLFPTWTAVVFSVKVEAPALPAAADASSAGEERVG